MHRIHLLFIFSFIIFSMTSLVWVKSTPSFLVQVGAQTVTDTWPQVQRDANRSGYVPQTVSSPYTKQWEVRHKVSSRVQPIIGPSHVYLPTNDNKLLAIDRSNGQTAWTFTTASANVNSAGFENNTVFFGSTDHHIYAVNASNGSLKWKYKTLSTVKTAPLLAEGKVFMGGSDGNFYALDQNTGQLIWKTSIGAPIYDTAAYDGGRIFFGALDAKGYALQASNGQVAWSRAIPGQGFRDRWTVAGNGSVFFTPVPGEHPHRPLEEGTRLFKPEASNAYAQGWSAQRTAILNYLSANPEKQPMHVLDPSNGQPRFTPPILYASGGGGSEHSQVVLLPNGNVNVVFRRAFGQPGEWGATTNTNLASGEMNLSTGDITTIDGCDVWGQSCNGFASPLTSDESVGLVRSGDILYLDIARGTLGLDLKNSIRLPTLATYNKTSGPPFGTATVEFTDYCYQDSTTCRTTGGGWRIDYDNIFAEVDGDGNNAKRPTPIVGDTFYILHYGSLIAVKGTLR